MSTPALQGCLMGTTISVSRKTVTYLKRSRNQKYCYRMLQRDKKHYGLYKCCRMSESKRIIIQFRYQLCKTEAKDATSARVYNKTGESI